MEVDVGQDWRDDTALRSAAVGPGVNPVFHNTRLKHAADQADEFLVIDPFPQQPQEDVVVDVLEEPRDIHIYEPFHPRPYGFDVFKRSEEHTSELQSLMRISYAVFCLKKKKQSEKTREKSSPHTTLY